MYKTTQYPHSRPIPSPFQSHQNNSSAIDIQDKRSPVRKEILKTVGSYTFTADVQEDIQAISLLNRKGLVAFVVTLKRDNEVLSQGRAIAIINRWNRYFEKVIKSTASAALVDAVVKSTRADTLDTEVPAQDKVTSEIAIGEVYQSAEKDGFSPASEKQCQYLTQLVKVSCDEETREKWLSQIGEMSKEEAGQAIAQFVN